MQVADLINTSQALAPVALRRAARELALQGLHASGQLRSAKRSIAARQGVVVLTLHRIVPDDELSACRSPRGMVLKESLFIKLLDYLDTATTLISPGEANVASPSSGRPRVLITFDDGWADNVEIALPHLLRASIQAYFFSVTSLVGKQAPFWPERVLSLLETAGETGQFGIINDSLDAISPEKVKAHPPVKNSERYEELLEWLKELPDATIYQWIESTRECLDEINLGACNSPTSDPLGACNSPTSDPRDRLMTWEQLQLLVDAGQAVGSHTCTHAILSQLDPELMESELRQSHYALREHLCLPDPNSLSVSYPNGSASTTVATAARGAQYQLGFLNSPGLWERRVNPFLIPRVNVWDGTLLNREGAFCERQLEYALFWKAHHATTRA